MQTALALAGGADMRPSYETKTPRFSGLTASYDLADDEIVVDSFAGAGGMSCGIEMAIGRSPDIAINHDPIAIRTHEANHPETTHYSASVYALDPRDLVPNGKRVGIFWASPDCRSHSRARGKAPKSKSVRDLAWVVVHWAELVSPRIIGVENVPEFTKWTELGPNGQPIPGTEGETFRKWIKSLEDLGYKVEWKILNAADHGAPTTRNRLFLQARRDGLPILWPEPTHGQRDNPLVRMGIMQPWRTASECIDYSLPTHSIFLTPEEARMVGCKRPLAEKTLRRIAKGMFRHVINNPSPFILSYYGERRPGDSFRGNGLDHPFATATTENRFGLVVPLTHQGDDRVYSANDTFRTITGANRGELAWVAPTMIQTGYGEREGQHPRCLDLQNPLGTVVAGGGKHAMVAAHLTCMNQNAAGSLPSEPLKTVMAGAVRHVYIASDINGPMDRSKEVADFLWHYRELSEKPVTRDRLGVVHVDGNPLRITDIGLRMLVGKELAKAQGFDPKRFDPTRRREDREDGTIAYAANTATSVVKMIGNSVSPPVGCAVIKAMLGHGVHEERKAA